MNDTWAAKIMSKFVEQLFHFIGNTRLFIAFTLEIKEKDNVINSLI